MRSSRYPSARMWSIRRFPGFVMRAASGSIVVTAPWCHDRPRTCLRRLARMAQRPREICRREGSSQHSPRRQEVVVHAQRRPGHLHRSLRCSSILPMTTPRGAWSSSRTAATVTRRSCSSSRVWSTPYRSRAGALSSGSKLVSSGALAPEALADALEAQRTELQGWRLGELLVHLGYVEQSVVEAFVREQVDDAMWDLMRWHNGRWKFRKNVEDPRGRRLSDGGRRPALEAARTRL